MSLPVMAADLTYARVNGGRATTSLVDWDEADRDPRAGERVLVGDRGTTPTEAVIDEVAADGTISLTVLAWAPVGPD